ncbi:hypothetical protein GCU68_12885 [Natronorubrum aibiense]|uniref:Winged helix-turn-helix domain-containing protein n=1 Tax=Natronorubrum aibiense TaxID=348826 RepID=A0A5P9P5D0_9EURY|nr:hypothetical protein GCU68_12885 [Natronorubrum aibiense]
MSRKPARWMCTLDERILEHLSEDPWSTPKYMSRAIKLTASRGRVEERCLMLSQVGLIAPIFNDSNMYEITGEGEEYLDGELDAENRPRPSPRARQDR